MKAWYIFVELVYPLDLIGVWRLPQEYLVGLKAMVSYTP
jgi:hypothetical protein